MANYGTILSECLQSPFNIDSYRKFVVNFLNGTQLKAISGLRSAENFPEFSYYVQGYALVGEYIDPNRKRVGIYAVKLNAGRDIEKARSKQRNFIAKLLVDNNFDAAIAAFYLNEESKWRLSFVRLDYEFAKGKVSKNLTPAKRYSYLVGKDEPCHTAQESLLPIFSEEGFTPSIDSIEQAFSIEKVTKQFFEKYKEKYLELKEYLEHTTCFVEEAEQRGFTSEQFAKKLMGQIVFLYFLQKKGWLGVSAINKEITERQYNNLYYYNLATRKFADKIYTKVADNIYKLNTAELLKLSQDEEECVAKALKGSPWGSGTRTFVRHIFNEAKRKNENFFDEYLEPLFYEGLNKKRDADNYYAPLHCRIPFLNGGLFEPLDNYDWENNFFSIPNEMFSNADIKGVREADGILDIFDRYNFTMNEDEPLEKEVAVDPEMLGKIFENLLDVSDRKSKGAFYTPREIVHYMCQESLTNYIVNTVGTPYEDTKDFVVYGEIMKDEDCSRESKYGFSKLLLADSIYKNLGVIDKALADVRVADPAVGSGAFPMGMLSEIVKLREIITDYMAREMYLEYKAAGKLSVYTFEKQKLYNETRNPYILKKDAMRNSIYAVDIEPSAVDIAKLRLWLTLVVEQEIDPNDPYNNSPVALPNLDCNIMCGNSLIDEFEGIDLSFDDIICNDTSQTSIFGNSVDNDLQILFKLQRDYFYADNHDEKFKLKQEIEEVKERILSLAFKGADQSKIKRFEAANTLHSTPFFLWKLNFAKVFKEKGGFDIVIGNPPYVDSETMTKNMPELREEYSRKYVAAKGNWDLYIPFWERAFTLLSNTGVATLITPNKWLSIKYGEALRNLLYDYIFCISDYSNFNAFESANVSTAVVFINKLKTTNIAVVKHNIDYSERKNFLVAKEVIREFDNLGICLSEKFETLNKLFAFKKLGSDFKISGAATVAETYEIAEIVEDNDNPTDEKLKFINTGTIDKFASLWGREEMTYVKNKYLYPTVSKVKLKNILPKRYAQAIAPKLITTGIRYLEVYADLKGEYLAAKSTEIITSKNGASIKALLPILNSNVAFFFIKEAYGGMAMGGGITFSPDNLSKIPIPNMDEKTTILLEKLADKYIANFDANSQDELDRIISQLFGFNEENYAVLEQFKFETKRKR